MIRNYLNLPEQLSQIYLNKYTVFLILILVQVVLLKRSLVDLINSQLLDQSTCDDSSKEVQPILNGLHDLIVDNLYKVQNSGLMSVLLLIKVIKNIVIFFIDLFFGTYICLLNALIRGTTEFALDSSETILKAVNQTVVEVTNDIEEGLQGLSQFINDLVTAFDTVKSFFTGSTSTKGAKQYEDKINLTLGNLKKKIMIPGTVLDEIELIKNSSLGSLGDLNNDTQVLIAKPFDLITKSLEARNPIKNKTSIYPINVKQVCLRNLNNLEKMQEDLVELVEFVAKWMIIGLVLASISAAIYVFFIEWRSWKRIDQFINEDTNINNEIEYRNESNIYENFILYTIVKRFEVNLKPRWIWLISYLTTKFTRNVLFFGIMGCLSVILQFVLLHYTRVGTERGMTIISRNLNGSSSEVNQYIRSMNNYINSTSVEVNEELFGNIRDTSSQLNSTISTFLDGLNDAVDEIFGKTPLSGPINTIVYCTIGRKLLSVEHGLTWISNNLKIELPSISKDMENSLQKVKFLQPETILSKLDSLIAGYKKSILLELWISLIFIGLWVLQGIIGIVILAIFEWKEQCNSQDPLSIGDPKQLNEKEKRDYGIPLSNPFPNLTASTYYQRSL